jgi:hypothetical protein
MSRPPILVDAHNLLHADAGLRALLGDIERARRELEARLRGRRDVLLFYDGGPGGEATVVWRDGLRCDYSGAGEADDRLIAWLRANPGRGAAVVSDDRALRARARTLGARLVATRAFLAALAGPAGAAPAKPEAPDEAELRMWLREFGADET